MLSAPGIYYYIECCFTMNHQVIISIVIDKLALCENFASGQYRWCVLFFI